MCYYLKVHFQGQRVNVVVVVVLVMKIITIITIFFLWRCHPTRTMASSILMFINHTQRHITVGKTPLDKWSARRRDLYLTIHNTQNRKTSTSPAGFESTILTVLFILMLFSPLHLYFTNGLLPSWFPTKVLCACDSYILFINTNVHIRKFSDVRWIMTVGNVSVREWIFYKSSEV